MFLFAFVAVIFYFFVCLFLMYMLCYSSKFYHLIHVSYVEKKNVDAQIYSWSSKPTAKYDVVLGADIIYQEVKSVSFFNIILCALLSLLLFVTVILSLFSVLRVFCLFFLFFSFLFFSFLFFFFPCFFFFLLAIYIYILLSHTLFYTRPRFRYYCQPSVRC